MSIVLPRILRAFDLYVGDNNYAGTCEKIKLPKNSPKLEELNAGGLSRPLKVAVGYDADWEMSFSTKGLDFDLLVNSNCSVDGVPIMILGSLGEGDSCIERAFKAYFWGQIQEADAGDLSLNELSTNDVTLAVARVQYFVDGKEIYFEDPMNMIRRINGKDQLAERRRHLGRQ
ncbi:phage major tail tube protein [Wohlfahrtiimonas sp. G9077]|uniref:phage major tail tube protein n=1 Tax=Wohlfahrtiimonas sp. G9077 TaxID=1980118 RepID=UPI000B9858A7|nr:phage major tail tube protein [Wohlfahrtiimonas sp. G9077]OYQ75242.1 hypothetical protein B9T20_00680 [Wohlfahrtiimonas sp. G9077]